MVEIAFGLLIVWGMFGALAAMAAQSVSDGDGALVGALLFIVSIVSGLYLSAQLVGLVAS